MLFRFILLVNLKVRNILRNANTILDESIEKQNEIYSRSSSNGKISEFAGDFICATDAVGVRTSPSYIATNLTKETIKMGETIHGKLTTDGFWINIGENKFVRRKYFDRV